MTRQIKTDADGFLVNPNDWNKKVMHELAEKDGLKLTPEHVKYIEAAREMFLANGTFPPIRKFAQHFGMSRKAEPLYALFESGVMKRLAKYSGGPKPTGCV